MIQYIDGGYCMKKLLFFDIDGTLIECNLGIYSIADDVKVALDKLKENGHDVFLATGRCKCFITDGVMNYPFSGYVTCNGACVEYGGETIYKQIIPSDAIKQRWKFLISIILIIILKIVIIFMFEMVKIKDILSFVEIGV